MYQRNFIPTTNKPTRLGKNSATAIVHIKTDYVSTCDFKTAILIVITLKNDGRFHAWSKAKYLFKCNYNENFQSPTTYNQLGWN